jgi:hypothetical protein
VRRIDALSSIRACAELGHENLSVLLIFRTANDVKATANKANKIVLNMTLYANERSVVLQAEDAKDRNPR